VMPNAAAGSFLLGELAEQFAARWCSRAATPYCISSGTILSLKVVPPPAVHAPLCPQHALTVCYALLHRQLWLTLACLVITGRWLNHDRSGTNCQRVIVQLACPNKSCVRFGWCG
jgi:hypothetical protein